EAARVEAEPGFVAADRGNEMPEADVRERSGTNDFADARPQPGDAAVDLWTEVPGEIMERKPELGRERQQRNVKLLSQPDAEAASGISPRVQGDSEVEIGADGRSRERGAGNEENARKNACAGGDLRKTMTTFQVGD